MILSLHGFAGRSRSSAARFLYSERVLVQLLHFFRGLTRQQDRSHVDEQFPLLIAAQSRVGSCTRAGNQERGRRERLRRRTRPPFKFRFFPHCLGAVFKRNFSPLRLGRSSRGPKLPNRASSNPRDARSKDTPHFGPFRGYILMKTCDFIETRENTPPWPMLKPCDAVVRQTTPSSIQSPP